MKIVDEFKEFAIKGSAVDMAVGIIIGGAFNGLVKSLVDNIMMPPIGMAVGGVDFNDLYIPLTFGHYESLAAAKEAGIVTVNYGMFVNATISFFITALALFMLIKFINHLRGTKNATPTTKTCPECKSTIHIEATRCPSCTSTLT